MNVLNLSTIEAGKKQDWVLLIKVNLCLPKAYGLLGFSKINKKAKSLDYPVVHTNYRPIRYKSYNT